MAGAPGHCSSGRRGPVLDDRVAAVGLVGRDCVEDLGVGGGEERVEPPELEQRRLIRVRRRTNTMRQRTALAWRSPPRLRRCRLVFPLMAGMGLLPQRAAEALSVFSRPGLSPAVNSRVEATSGPTALMATRSGATAWVMRRSRVVTSLSCCSRCSLRWASSRRANRVTAGRASSSGRIRNAAQIAGSWRPGRGASRARSSSGAVTSSWWIWFRAWVQVLLPLPCNAFSVRSASTGPSWLLGLPVSSPDWTARAGQPVPMTSSRLPSVAGRRVRTR